MKMFAKFLCVNVFVLLLQVCDKSDYGVRVLAKLANYQVYTTLNAKNQFRAPTEWGICLRPAGLGSDDFDNPGFLCLACDSEKARSCWLTAMRLAKVSNATYTYIHSQPSYPTLLRFASILFSYAALLISPGVV